MSFSSCSPHSGRSRCGRSDSAGSVLHTVGASAGDDLIQGPRRPQVHSSCDAEARVGPGS